MLFKLILSDKFCVTVGTLKRVFILDMHPKISQNSEDRIAMVTLVGMIWASNMLLQGMLTTERFVAKVAHIDIMHVGG